MTTPKTSKSVIQRGFKPIIGPNPPMTDTEHNVILAELQKNFTLIEMDVFGHTITVRGDDKYIIIAREDSPSNEFIVCRKWFQFFTTHISIRPKNLLCKCDGNHRGERYVPPCQSCIIRKYCKNGPVCRFAHLKISNSMPTSKPDPDLDEVPGKISPEKTLCCAQFQQYVDYGNEIIMWMRIEGKIYALMRISAHYDDKEIKRIELFHARNVPTEKPIQSTIRALYESSAWLFDLRTLLGISDTSDNVWMFNNVFHCVCELDTDIPMSELMTKIFDENQLKLARALRAGERAAVLNSVGLVLVPLDEKERDSLTKKMEMSVSHCGSSILQEVSDDKEMCQRLATCESFRLREIAGQYKTITFALP